MFPRYLILLKFVNLGLFKYQIMTELPKNDSRVINGWAMFDWANSAYSLVISTAVFPPFFASIAPDFLNVFGISINSNSLYSYSVSLAFVLMALLIPLLSGIADYSGKRKFFLKLFTIIGSISCMVLFFFNDAGDVALGLSAFILGTIGFGVGIVFYNAYLPEIATEDRFDAVSARGYAFGYIGSVILLAIILLMISFYSQIGLSSSSMAIRIGFVLVGIWWIGFAFLAFRVLPSDSKQAFDRTLFKEGFKELQKVGRAIKAESNTITFLSSYFFFIAGVNVIIYLASIFAKEDLNFGSSELIVLILLLQFLATIGAYFFAFLSDKKGNKLSLMIQIFIWIFICLLAYFTQSKFYFYILAGFVGLVFGGIQSLSRSSYSKFIEDDDIPLTSYYSFYDVLTKLAVVFGTLMFGLVNQLTGSMRYSILVLSVFFIVGALILAKVNFQKKIQLEEELYF